MVVIRVLGILDLLCALGIFFAALLPQSFVLLLAVYLISKGGIFAFGGDVVSYIDVGCGIYMLFLFIGISNLLVSGLFMFYLIQKSVFSLM